MRNIFENKVILITGGTGFLGIALTKEILKYKPASIRLFSRDEVKHHKVSELFENNTKIRNFIGDIRDYQRLKKAVRGADYVIHAAALKRLDLIEYNVEESIKTNIMGTLNVVNACLDSNVLKAIMVSSDKACSPANTYGACKFVGERIFTESNFSKGDKKTVFSTVRYGNVLESTGSVIPFFEKKIKDGLDIPLTDERMTRYFIAPSQAVELIFNALRIAHGGEVIVPKLPAFRIIDLIEILKEKHNAKNKIKTIGIRPGEKIHELMINSSEIPRTYAYEDLYVITSNIAAYVDIEKADYINEDNRLSEKNMEEYNSKDCVVSKEQIQRMLKKFCII